MKKNIALVAIAAAALSLPLALTACGPADEKTETTEVSVDAAGTVTETTTETTTEFNRDGSVESVSGHTETTVDPEGLGNQETVNEESIEVQVNE